MSGYNETVLKAKTKKEVFAIYCRVCLGRIHSAQISEMNKSWMIHDIIKATTPRVK